VPFSSQKSFRGKHPNPGKAEQDKKRKRKMRSGDGQWSDNLQRTMRRKIAKR
jgi:hypothetical protein